MNSYLSNKISHQNHIEPWTLFCQSEYLGGGLDKGWGLGKF